MTAKKPKWTEGPWETKRSIQVTDNTFDYAISAEGAPVLAEAFGRAANGDFLNAEANARLIAAAPEMAEVLERLTVSVRLLHIHCVHDQGWLRHTAKDIAAAQALLSKLHEAPQ